MVTLVPAVKSLLPVTVLDPPVAQCVPIFCSEMSVGFCQPLKHNRVKVHVESLSFCGVSNSSLRVLYFLDGGSSSIVWSQKTAKNTSHAATLARREVVNVINVADFVGRHG